eukprot:TRINITY_DN37863_c0_g1_i2.p1 TRINITY_DN37863_c0_g1~~TRINITY_DN37863_c0_g1_i2.p1  ORF type:complete len:553 (+),score=133.59 TRINITY_DN37863_c0_g1_i2:60-1661(+)
MRPPLLLLRQADSERNRRLLRAAEGVDSPAEWLGSAAAADWVREWDIPRRLRQGGGIAVLGGFLPVAAAELLAGGLEATEAGSWQLRSRADRPAFRFRALPRPRHADSLAAALSSCLPGSVDLSGAWYGPGDFIATHTDEADNLRTGDMRRRVALILHLTSAWDPQWGGGFADLGPGGAPPDVLSVEGGSAEGGHYALSPGEQCGGAAVWRRAGCPRLAAGGGDAQAQLRISRGAGGEWRLGSPAEWLHVAPSTGSPRPPLGQWRAAGSAQPSVTVSGARGDTGASAVEPRVPRFNTLVAFEVPRSHCVVPVTAAARGRRLSLFGWAQEEARDAVRVPLADGPVERVAWQPPDAPQGLQLQAEPAGDAICIKLLPPTGGPAMRCSSLRSVSFDPGACAIAFADCDPAPVFADLGALCALAAVRCGLPDAAAAAVPTGEVTYAAAGPGGGSVAFAVRGTPAQLFCSCGGRELGPLGGLAWGAERGCLLVTSAQPRRLLLPPGEAPAVLGGLRHLCARCGCSCSFPEAVLVRRAG